MQDVLLVLSSRGATLPKYLLGALKKIERSIRIVTLSRQSIKGVDWFKGKVHAGRGHIKDSHFMVGQAESNVSDSRRSSSGLVIGEKKTPSMNKGTQLGTSKRARIFG